MKACSLSMDNISCCGSSSHSPSAILASCASPASQSSKREVPRVRQDDKPRDAGDHEEVDHNKHDSTRGTLSRPGTDDNVNILSILPGKEDLSLCCLPVMCSLSNLRGFFVCINVWGNSSDTAQWNSAKVSVRTFSVMFDHTPLFVHRSPNQTSDYK